MTDYASVVDVLPESVLLYAGGVIVYANPAAASALGVPEPAALHGRTLLEDVEPLDRARMARALELAAQGQAQPADRFELRTLSGAVRVASCSFTPIEVDGRPHLQVLARDVTARVRLEDAVAESEGRFRAIFENSSVGMAVVGEDQRLMMVNEAMSAILGLPPDRLVGMQVDDVTHPDDLELSKQVTRRLDDGEPAVTVRKRYLRPDGRTVWGELTAVRVSGLTEGRSVVQLRDVSETHQAVEDLRHLALHDPMTDLGNRALLLERLQHALAGRPAERPMLAGAVRGPGRLQADQRRDGPRDGGPCPADRRAPAA